MLVLHKLSDLDPAFAGSAVAIGNFDGIHLGHAALLRGVQASAQGHRVRSCVLTFYPHPSDVLRSESAVERLTTTEEKLATFETFGIELVFVVSFNPELAQLKAEDFFERYLRQGLQARAIHVGVDFRFGQARRGDAECLRTLCGDAGIDLSLEPPVMIEGRRVSSTWIRELLSQGDVAQAAKCLGRPYRLRGAVVHGDGRGATVGFPTANLTAPAEKLLPKNGVYLCQAIWQRQRFRAVVNIGVRPTFGANQRRSVEAHLLDFNAQIYDETIELEFLERIRDEKRFGSVNELTEQIRLDIEHSRRRN